MDLELSEVQDQLVHTLSTVFAKACTTESVRGCEPLGFDPALWRQLVEFGRIDKATALEFSPNADQLKMMLKGIKVAAPGIL